MILLTKHLVIYMFALITVATGQTDTHDITVTIDNLRSNEGKVLIGLYNSETDFLSEVFMGKVVSISDNSCTVTFKDVPKGIYAVSYVHDENDNGKMDTNFVGIPKEDYGCSNNAKGFMSAPKWEDAKFELNKTIELFIN